MSNCGSGKGTKHVRWQTTAMQWLTLLAEARIIGAEEFRQQILMDFGRDWGRRGLTGRAVPPGSSQVIDKCNAHTHTPLMNRCPALPVLAKKVSFGLVGANLLLTLQSPGLANKIPKGSGTLLSRTAHRSR